MKYLTASSLFTLLTAVRPESSGCGKSAGEESHREHQKEWNSCADFTNLTAGFIENELQWIKGADLNVTCFVVPEKLIKASSGAG